MITPKELAVTLGAAPQTIARMSGAVVDDWISVQAWYIMIAAIGLRPGGRLQRLAAHEWHASR
ncbi:hypothetical protein [Rhodococcus erythropolis]|uniref:hypothetical protein n=1 Tax=Rhodococcus erythropolis TaxID=1833 RepID=UPI002226CD3B|nr:hypothetical protein [Rhodococcus erythropolis]MCW2295466.1 hypothetical protein [Rhodococcus erythropolis]